MVTQHPQNCRQPSPKWSLGCIIKSKNEVWKGALWNQGVLMYEETGSEEKILIFHFLPTPFFTLKIPGPLYESKKNSSDYRLHGTQNDRLEPTVSMQKSVLKNMHWVQRYWRKGSQILSFCLKSQIRIHFCQYLRTRYIFLKTDFCDETVGLRRSFWVPRSL